MTKYRDLEKIKPNSILSFPSISNLTKIDGFIFLLNFTIKVGKYFPIISILFVGLNLLLAANDFLANRINFAILNSIFAIVGVIFLAQSYQSRKDHSFEYQLANKIDKKQLIEIRELN